jgi:hypothetical protein
MPIKGFALAALAAAGLVTAMQSQAAPLYDDGPDALTGAWYINTGSVVADSFVLSASSTLTEVTFSNWLSLSSTGAPNTATSVDWAITSSAGGPVIDSGTASLTSSLATTQGSFAIYNASFLLPSDSLSAGTYWLQLGNEVVSNDGGGYWGVSAAGTSTAFRVSSSPFQSLTPESFQLYGTTVPEPATFSLLGLGLAGVGFMRRRKKI